MAYKSQTYKKEVEYQGTPGKTMLMVSIKEGVLFNKMEEAIGYDFGVKKPKTNVLPK